MARYIGYNPITITGMGPTCSKQSRFFLHFLIQHGRCQNLSFFGFTLSAILQFVSLLRQINFTLTMQCFVVNCFSSPVWLVPCRWDIFYKFEAFKLARKKGPTRFGFRVFGMLFFSRGWKQKHQCCCLFSFGHRQEDSNPDFFTRLKHRSEHWKDLKLYLGIVLGKKQPLRNKPLLRDY